MIDALLTFAGSGVCAMALAAVVRHYHRLRTAAAINMHQANVGAIAALANDTREIKVTQSHLHECLEDLKGRVAANNSHEERIGRLEDIAMAPRKRPPALATKR